MNSRVNLLLCSLLLSCVSFANYFVCEFEHENDDGKTFTKVSYETESCRKEFSDRYAFKMKDFAVLVDCKGDFYYVEVVGKKQGFARLINLSPGKDEVRTDEGKTKKRPLIEASTSRAAESSLRVKCKKKRRVKENFFNVPTQRPW